MKFNFYLIFIVLCFISNLTAQRNNPIRPIKENGKWGFYNFNISKVIIEPQYDRIGDRTSWGQKIINDNKIGLIQFSNSFIIEPEYTNFVHYDEFLIFSYQIYRNVNSIEVSFFGIPKA